MDKKRALALGFFDGVHAAHKTVLALARAYADEAEIPAAAVTFDRSPAAFIRGTSDELICTLDERIELLKTEGGMDEVIVLPFDAEMMGTAAADFVKNHHGEWNHRDWLEFCAYLEDQGYTPIDLDQVGLLLEKNKTEYFNGNL